MNNLPLSLGKICSPTRYDQKTSHSSALKEERLGKTKQSIVQAQVRNYPDYYEVDGYLKPWLQPSGDPLKGEPMW